MTGRASEYWRLLEELILFLHRHGKTISFFSEAVQSDFDKKRQYLEDYQFALTSEEVKWIEEQQAKLFKKLGIQ